MQSDFFGILSTHASGVFVLLAVIAAIILFVQWVAWIFNWGRFAATKRDPRGGIRYVFADLLVKIIDDFRHLLALVITIIFALALAYTLYLAATHSDDGSVLEGVKDALQAVVSSLGGLVGAIIGYYFGESAAKRKPGETPDSPKRGGGEVTQQQEQDDDATIASAPPPPASS